MYTIQIFKMLYVYINNIMGGFHASDLVVLGLPNRSAKKYINSSYILKFKNIAHVQGIRNYSLDECCLFQYRTQMNTVCISNSAFEYIYFVDITKKMFK